MKDPEITQLLKAWSAGDSDALERVLPLVYGRLRELASGFLSSERAAHTLESAALVNEAYLRLIQLDEVSWNDRAHFFALSARLMRRILVDHARRASSAKRGSRAAKISLEDAPNLATGGRQDFLALDLALRELAEHDAQLARIVELRYFGALNRDEIAAVMGLSSATVTRRWRMARAWLYQYLQPASTHEA